MGDVHMPLHLVGRDKGGNGGNVLPTFNEVYSRY